MGLQRRRWDHTGIRDAAGYQHTWAVGAFLDNAEGVASNHPLAFHALIKGTSCMQEPLGDNAI